jgi:hypothetical protein
MPGRKVASRWPLYGAAAATGALLGVAGGIPLSSGDARPVIAAALLCATVPLITRALPVELRTPLGVVLLLALAARFAAAVVLFTASVAAGQDGWITGDDWNYAELAWGYASWVHGTPYPPYVPPSWNTDVYLFGTYVYVESAIFFLFGRQVLLMEFVNSWALIVAVVLLFDVARRLFAQRAALITFAIVLAYPSLFVWSVLNLKDALSLLLITATFWVLVRFQARPAWWSLAAIFIVLEPIQSLRRYVYLLLLISIAVAALLAVSRHPGRRRLAAAAAIVAVALFVSDFRSTSWFGNIDLDLFETVRQNMAAGARTSFQEPAPTRVFEGTTYVVVAGALPTAAPSLMLRPTPAGPPGVAPATPQPTCAPGLRTVDRAARLVLTTVPSPPPASAGVVYVCVGDVIVFGADTTPAPSAAQPLVIYEEARVVLRRSPTGEISPVVITSIDSLDRTIAYLPKGLTYALLAPFPWAPQRTLDLLTIPEMLVWYALLAVAAVSLLRMRRMWFPVLPFVVYALGLVVAFSLAEGNYGTLYRHRAMLLPFVVLLASPTLTLLWPRPSRAGPGP